MILFSEKNLEYNTITYIEEKNIYIYICVCDEYKYIYVQKIYLSRKIYFDSN